jgi:hypothetical protein
MAAAAAVGRLLRGHPWLVAAAFFTAFFLGQVEGAGWAGFAIVVFLIPIGPTVRIVRGRASVSTGPMVTPF